MDLKRDLEPFFLGGVFRSMDSISFSVNVLRPIRAEKYMENKFENDNNS